MKMGHVGPFLNNSWFDRQNDTNAGRYTATTIKSVCIEISSKKVISVLSVMVKNPVQIHLENRGLM
jgi:hypothetical protein